MSNTGNFAKTELDILIKSNTDPNNRPVIEDFISEIIALCDKFGNSGQSGGSAPYVAKSLANTVEKLCLQKPICPITGVDEEWVDVSALSDGSEPGYQNKRCSALFKNSNGDVRYIDAIVKKTQHGSTWSGPFWLSKKDYLTGNRDLMIRCPQLIRGFPFTPKTFYIDVIEEEVAPDDFEMYLKDKSQLDEVFEYYKERPTTREVLTEKKEIFF